MLISSSIFLFLDSIRVALHDSQFTFFIIYYVFYTGALCSLSVISFLLKVWFVSSKSPLCSDWPASESFFWLWKQHNQTLVVGFCFSFLFFTQNINFSNTSALVGTKIRSEICEWTARTSVATKITAGRLCLVRLINIACLLFDIFILSVYSSLYFSRL